MAPRAEKNAGSKVRKAPAVRSPRQKILRAASGVFLLIFLLVCLIWGVFSAKKFLFTGNPRFLLRRIVLKSSGFWEGKEEVLSKRLFLSKGTNLFTLNPAGLRKKLMAIPGIENASVSLELPDTLVLKLMERLPRAALDYPRSPWVVDEQAVLIPRREAMGSSMDLPVIAVGRITVRPGEKLEQLRPALELIMMTISNFSDISVRYVRIQNDQHRPDRCKLIFVMRYRDWKQCRVEMPLYRYQSNTELLTRMLSNLQSAIIDSEWRREKRSNFNLSYEGQVVASD